MVKIVYITVIWNKLRSLLFLYSAILFAFYTVFSCINRLGVSEAISVPRIISAYHFPSENRRNTCEAILSKAFSISNIETDNETGRWKRQPLVYLHSRNSIIRHSNHLNFCQLTNLLTLNYLTDVDLQLIFASFLLRPLFGFSLTGFVLDRPFIMACFSFIFNEREQRRQDVY